MPLPFFYRLNSSSTPVRPIWEILHLLFHTCLDYVSITLYNLYK